ncbi:hypothetical protein AOQ84DRAFT_282435, partial [Glonium stellatum]
STKTLNVYHTAYHRDYRITNSGDEPVYYVCNLHFHLNTPDVTLHAGSEKTDPTLGAAEFSSMFSKSIMIALGDPGANSDVPWHEIVRTSNPLLQSEFKFTVDTPRYHDSAHGQAKGHSGTTFIWKRSSETEVGDGAAHSLQNFKLVDEGTGETVATFANNGLGGWKKKGRFRIVEGVYGGDWENLVLLSCLSLIEKAGGGA